MISIPRVSTRPVQLEAPTQPKPVDAGKTPRPATDGFDPTPRDWSAFNGTQRLAQGEEGGEVGGAGAKDPVRSTVKLSKKSERAIEHMWRDNDPPLTEAEQKKIKAAFTELTEKQILQLDKSDMRIWKGQGLPPDLADLGLGVPKLTTRAAYHPGLKVLQLNPDKGAFLSDLRHELGHARDDIGDEKKATKPIAKIADADARIAAIEKNAGMMSTSSKQFATQTLDGDRKLVSAKMTIGEAREKFLARVENVQDDDLFNSGNARDGYARKSPEEFYAEAYATYHGSDTQQQARLLAYAPEMFFILQADAKANKMPVLDVKVLEDTKL